MLCDIDSWVDANVNIVIRNNYGEKRYKIVLPSEVYAKSYTPSDFSSQTRCLDVDVQNFKFIEVYDKDGIYMSKINSIQDLGCLKKACI